MHKNRVRTLNHSALDETKDYVLYWLQHTQRVSYNYALGYAINEANRLKKPLKVVFVLTPDFPEANKRHYQFMLEGIVALYDAMNTLNVSFDVVVGAFKSQLNAYLKNACLFVMDDAYLRGLRDIKRDIAKAASVSTVQVVSDLIVPVDKASDKCEYSARTIRPKLLKHVDDYLDNNPVEPCRVSSKDDMKQPSLDTLLKHIDNDIPVSSRFTGGYQEAMRMLHDFIDTSLCDYKDSNDPSKQLTSTLSPYLHFGQVSPVEVYLLVESYKDNYRESVENFLEQLLVRRELAYNFVWYCDGYDQFDQMTYDWAYKTMDLHRDDERDYIYNEHDYVTFNTHDVYFNAAMKEMVITGYMHNYMRMYWAKKIIEWSDDYQSAYELIVMLNNRYFIDGRDAVSYASIAWVFGRHDRAWTERPVFGKLRYMNANGLKRKFDIDAYVKWCDEL
ncbi:MAG: deoxyribodipyrimidine photo-lyase [Bacillota bacterium]